MHKIINFIKEFFGFSDYIEMGHPTIEPKPKRKRKYTKRKPAEAGLPVETTKKKRGRPAKVKK
jgi:hypothetical protein